MQVPPIFHIILQVLPESCFFAAQFRTASYIRTDIRKNESVVDLFISCFKFFNTFFDFFKFVFLFTLASLFFFLLLPGKFSLRRCFFFCFFSGFLCRWSIFLSQFFFFLQIIIVISDIVDNRLICQIKNTGCSLVDEITVMRNIQHSSGIAVQCFFQNFLGCDIQMVGRLIKDQEIGFGKHQFGKRNTTSFATGKRGDHFEYIVSGKEKCCQHITDLCLGQCRICV